MGLIIKPEKMLEVIWKGSFETINIYEDGTWDIGKKKRNDVITSLSRNQLTEKNKLEALNQLMILNTKLLEATTEEYADRAKKAYEKAHELWKEANIMSKEFAEIKGEKYCESPFEYSPFSTVEEQLLEYYGQFMLDYLIDIQFKLSREHCTNFDFNIYDEGDETYGGVAEDCIIGIPFDSTKIAFFISDDKCTPVYYIDKNHPLFSKLENEISRVPKLSLDNARNSVEQDLREWFKSQFGYDISLA